MNNKISWCATTSENDVDKLDDTINSIYNQPIKPYEIIITDGGNISEGRNKYLKKVDGDIIATFDGGCIYKKDYLQKLIAKMNNEKADIVFGMVKTYEPKNKIQKFCISRMPDYDKFIKEDWDNFIPSNRQVIFKKDVIEKLGLLPEELWRSDDTYWFQKAKKLGLKFSYSKDAIVYWEMKVSLKSYLKAVYNDTKCDYQFGIKPFGASKRRKQNKDMFYYFVFFLAGISKVSGIIAGKINHKKTIII